VKPCLFSRAGSGGHHRYKACVKGDQFICRRVPPVCRSLLPACHPGPMSSRPSLKKRRSLIPCCDLPNVFPAPASPPYFLLVVFLMRSPGRVAT